MSINEFGLYVWPRTGWLEHVPVEELRNSVAPSRVPGGQTVRGQFITWIDDGNAVLCTCGENSETMPCRHALRAMACNEAVTQATEMSAMEIVRTRAGLAVDIDRVAQDIAASLGQFHPEDEAAAGFCMDGDYHCHSHALGWLRASMPSAAALGSIARRTTQRQGDRIWVPETALPDILELSRAGGAVTADRQLAKYLSFANSERVTHAQPSTLQATLDAAQIEGFSWLVDLHDHGLSGILADEMGIGKTMQIIALVLFLKERGDFQRAMISVPSGAVDHWMKELATFAPSLEAIAWEGAQRKKMTPILPSMDIVVTTHKIMTIDQALLRAMDWSVLAVDEAQDGKNPESELALSSAVLPARQKIPVTATPVENSLVDLHTLMTIAAPGLLGRLTHFRREISDKVKRNDEAAEEILADLHRIVSPFMKHRTQQSAGLSIPPPNIVRQDIPLTIDRSAYETVRDRAQQMLKDRSGSIFQLITMLRQTAADYRLLDADERGSESTKTAWIADRVRDEIERGRKVLLFSTWTTHLDLLRAAMLRRGVPLDRIGRIDGGMNRREKRWAEEDFKTGTTDILEMTMRAGGRTLNLPESDTVILGVPWWNPSVMRQAAYRAVRRGQTKTIDVLIPIAADTIEIQLMDIQERKSQIAHSILKPSAGFGGLTRRELENMIYAS